MNVEPILRKEFFLSAGETNAEQEMSLPLLVSKLIDIATRHANLLKIGNPYMEHKNAGWVLARLTVEMLDYPKENESYFLSTWIDSYTKHFSNRCFKIEKANGEIAGYARSIWMVLDTETRQHLPLSSLPLPNEAILGKDVPIDKQAKHLTQICHDEKDYDPKTCLMATSEPYEYTFEYCDLDAYRHVNTVRYVSLLLNRFTLEQHDKTRVRRIELSFMHEAAYGLETLLYRADDTENPMISSFALMKKEDEAPLMFARLFREPR